MRTFGETLRQARLDKGVSLVDAERDTHIRRRYLEALEAEDSAALPSSVYARGFVRTYAEYLGLNPEAMVELFQPERRREQAPPTLRPALPHVALPRELPIRPILYGLGALLLVGGVAYLWITLQNLAREFRDPGAAPSLRAGTSVPPRLPTPNPVAFASPSPSPSPTATPVPSPTPAPSPTPVLDGIVVEFRTTARVYVEAAVDGQQALAETLPAGAERTLPLAKQEVVLRVSNGSAIQATYNGTPQPPPTDTGPYEFTWRR